MPLSSLLLYIVSFAVMATSCWLVLGLVRRFRLYFLSSYLGFLVAIDSVEILNLIATDLSADVLKGIPAPGMEGVYILFGLATFPLLAIAFYFYLTFIAGLLEKELTLTFRIVYIIIWALLLGGFLFRIQFALQQRNPPLAQVVNIAFGLVLFTPIAALVNLLIRTARIPRAEEKMGLMNLALVLLTGYMLFLATFFLTQAGSSFRWAAPLCFLMGNIAPILALRSLLRRNVRTIPPEMFSYPNMGKLRESFQISPREGEVLNLLLQGKSNKDIERALFVSPHTVRNHVHNIYQKLGVGSRLQLLNFIGSRMERNEKEK